jgi:hypothetical protein
VNSESSRGPTSCQRQGKATLWYLCRVALVPLRLNPTSVSASYLSDWSLGHT